MSFVLGASLFGAWQIVILFLLEATPLSWGAP
jgi:hypothetical protein